LATGPSAHHILRKSFVNSARRISVAEEMFIVADKYDMPSIRKLIGDEFLPQAFEVKLSIGHPYHSMSKASILSTHYSLLSKHFSATGGYPRDLWAFYVTSVVEYRHTDPYVDLISHLEDNPKMACYVANQLSIRLATKENEVKALENEIKELSVQNANIMESTYPEGALEKFGIASGRRSRYSTEQLRNLPKLPYSSPQHNDDVCEAQDAEVVDK
jgi:hypothetical protein